MGSRLELQNKLEDILGSRNVYFQPPESIKLKFPCIVYHMNKKNIKHADNLSYKKDKSYTVTIIDSDPDSEIGDILESNFEYCSQDRQFTSDNLNHFVYTLYY